VDDINLGLLYFLFSLLFLLLVEKMKNVEVRKMAGELLQKLLELVCILF
jgi:hypothetical protein